jgi:hypothetical protein
VHNVTSQSSRKSLPNVVGTSNPSTGGNGLRNIAATAGR